MGKLKIVSWNCQNGFNKEKQDVIVNAYPDADIFVIQESKREDVGILKSDFKYKNWYGDDQEYSDLGILVFSKTCKIEFTDEFSRKFRYVVPYKVTTAIEKRKIILIAVWTKPVPVFYDKNIVDAIHWPEYKNITTDNVVIIGDFNTSSNDEHPERYSDLVKNLAGFKNCALGLPEEAKKTFYSISKKKLYSNDFCFISEKFNNGIKNMTFKIRDDWEENEYGQKRWKGLSDHCPIVVDFEFLNA
ncbi:hypothetical protein LQZ19_07750 [Treponema primitia]|uniref:endonuclease/exonuclease/phosphatase family protein n=1 Tax=Treponema primitia TaxID=88058 RepID=UPI00398033FB